MAKLPLISGNKAIKAFTKAGFVVDKIKGDDATLIKKDANPPKIIMVPLKRELKKGTLRNAIKHSGLSKEEFCCLL